MTEDFGPLNGFGSRTMQEPQHPFSPAPLNGSLSNNLLCILYENNPYADTKQLILNSVVWTTSVKYERGALLPPSGFGMFKMDIFQNPFIQRNSADR